MLGRNLDLVDLFAKHIVLVHQGEKVGNHPIGGIFRVRPFCQSHLIEMRNSFLAGKDFGIIRAQAKLCHEALLLDVRQLWQLLANSFHLFRSIDHDGQIGVGEVTVFVGTFFVALYKRALFIFIPSHCTGANSFATLIQLDLAFCFILNGTHETANAVEVLHFGALAKGGVIFVHDAHVGFKAQDALAHVPMIDAQITQDVPQFAGVCLRLFSGANVWFRYNLKQGHASAVVIHQRPHPNMGEFARVFFHVSAPHTNALGPPIGQVNINVAIDREGMLVLANLVALRKIGIEITLAGKLAKRGDVTMEGKPHHQPVFHRSHVDDG